MRAPRLTRRQFLKLGGAAGALALPTALGYRLLRSTAGELPPNGSPYADLSDRTLPPGEAAAPILVLTNDRAGNPFGAYLTEILYAEGLNCFRRARVSEVDGETVSRFSLVLVAEGPLDRTQVELLEDYVSRGGRLVAMRPEARLAALFGVERASGDTSEGYLWRNADHPVGQAIVAEALQFHGTADHYRLGGAQAVAWLSSDAQARTDYPAVAFYRYGQGQAAAWAFDLAQSIVLTRQGNPAWANLARLGFEGNRAHHAFIGWIDLNRIAIPQADEQMRLLSRLVSEMLADTLPLPRLWYFPGAAETMLIATGDAHQNPASAVEDVLTRAERRGGHMSIYYAPPLASRLFRAVRRTRDWANDLPLVGEALTDSGSPPTPGLIAQWRGRGHEFGVHPYVEEGLEAGWRRYWETFTGLGYDPVPPTVRTHRALWMGWVETARVQAMHGMRLNLDFYHYGKSFQKPDGNWVYGHFTGSGLPMRFVDEQGRILNIYQQLTALVDEHLMATLWGGGGGPNLSVEEALEVSRTLLHRSLQGGYSAIGGQFHVDPFALGDEWVVRFGPFLEGTLDYAAANNIPIWSAVEWLHFTEVRHDAAFEDVQWNAPGERLSFNLVAEAAPDIELSVMTPLQHGKAKLVRVEVDGSTALHHERTIGGIDYGWVAAEARPHRVTAFYV